MAPRRRRSPSRERSTRDGAWAGIAHSWAPGPGILGSASALGHGGLAALANAHAALSLGSRGRAGAATLERRRARPPPRPEPPHRHGAAHAAAPRAGARTRGPLAAVRRRARRAPSPAAGTRVSAWTCPRCATDTSRAACRAGRWGARSRRTGTSSSPGLPAEHCWPRLISEKEQTDGVRAGRQRGRVRGSDRHRAGREVPPRRRRGRRARGGRAPRRGRDAAPRRRPHLARAPAARGGRGGEPARAAGRAS